MPSIALCANADVPVDIAKTLQGFDNEMAAATFLIKQHLSKATGRLDASRLLKEVDDAVRAGKDDCIDYHFGD